MGAAREFALQKVREICGELPYVLEKLSHGSPSFFIDGVGQFGVLVDDHHGDGRLALWLAAPMGVQEALISEDPNVYFRPPYVGPKGWVGVRLDRELSNKSVTELVELAHATIFAKSKRKPNKR